MKNSTLGKLWGEVGGRGTPILKIRKRPIQNDVPLQTKSVSTLAHLKNVYKSGELKCEEKERRNPVSIYGYFQSYVKTSIKEDLTRGFYKFVRMCH